MNTNRIPTERNNRKRNQIAALTLVTALSLAGLAVRQDDSSDAINPKVCAFVADKDDARQGEGELTREFGVGADNITITDPSGNDIETLGRDLGNDLGDASFSSNVTYAEMQTGDKVNVRVATKAGALACIEHNGSLN